MNWTSNLQTLIVNNVMLVSLLPQCISNITTFECYTWSGGMVSSFSSVIKLITHICLTGFEYLHLPNLTHLEYLTQYLDYEPRWFPRLQYFKCIGAMKWINIPSVIYLHCHLFPNNDVKELTTWTQLTHLIIEIWDPELIIDLLSCIPSLINLTHLTIHCHCNTPIISKNCFDRYLTKLEHYEHIVSL